MGKGSRNKQQNAARRCAEEERQQAIRQKKRRRRKIISLCAAILAAAVLLSGGTVLGVRYYKASGAALRGVEVLSSENFSVDAAMMTYFFNENYQTYVSENSSYLSYMGLDTTESLKTQEYADGVTWFDYLMEQTQSQVREYLLFAEAANAAGMTLTDSDKENIQSHVESQDLASYGAGIKAEDATRCLELTALAYKYYSSEYNAFECTDAEIEEYYSDNVTDFTSYDLLTYTLYYVTEDEATEGDITKATVDAYVDRLRGAASAAEFEDILTEYLSNEEGLDNDTLVSELSGIEVAGTTYTDGDEVSEWVYADGRALWDTYVIDDGAGSVEIYKLSALPYRDESSSIDVRHILFSFDEYGSSSGAKEAADRVYAEWQSGDATEESFAELATTYSDDEGSVENGGLYTGVTEGQMVESFNDWCFDDARQPGDTDIVETDYGYHIMYFVGGGVEAWASDVQEAMWSEQYDAILEKLGESYTVTVQSDKLEKIEPVIIDASSSSKSASA